MDGFPRGLAGLPTLGLALTVALALAACGGGGGASAPATVAGDAGGSAPTTAATPPAFPSLVPAGGFALPSLPTAPDHGAAAGTQQGRVWLRAGVTAARGAAVDWLDATSPDAPVVIASTTAADDGSFVLRSPSVAAHPADQWLRATLADGTVLRGYATGWAEVTPASEAVVRELTRLRKAGAFVAHDLQVEELRQAQASITLASQDGTATGSPAQVTDAWVVKLRFFAPWNALLDRLNLAQPSAAADDIAGFFTVGGARWPSTVVTAAASSQATFNAECASSSTPSQRFCSVSSGDVPALADQNTVQLAGATRNPANSGSRLDNVLSQLGPLPLLEFPIVAGTRVIQDQPQFTVPLDPTLRAAVKVTRRTYDAAPVDALGGTVQAVQIVLDFEIALLDVQTGQQTDTLLREARWYSPGAGRVRFETTQLTRTGTASSVASPATPVTTTSARAVATAVSGAFFAPDTLPFAGVIDVVSLPLRHRHAIYSASTNRVYAATPTAQGGAILELDGDSLQTLRTLATPAVPGRLALSGDGRTLYAGLDGGQLVEWRVSDLSQVRQTQVIADPYGAAYRRIFDLAVDPFDPERVLVLAGGVSFGDSGALLLYRQGALVPRDAPRYNANDYGWGAYSPNVVAWSGVRDEYLAAFLGSPKSIYRFKADETAGSTTEVASLARVDDVGVQDRGGTVLTSAGRTLDATTFSVVGALGFASRPLTGCNRQDPATTLCEVAGVGLSPPVFVRLDQASSAFLGTYRPAIGQVTNGCGSGARDGSLGLDDRVLTAIDTRRSLVSALTAGDAGERCTLQRWTLHGVQ